MARSVRVLCPTLGPQHCASLLRSNGREVQAIDFAHDDAHVRLARRIPAADDPQGGRIVMATSRDVFVLEPVSLEQQVGGGLQRCAWGCCWVAGVAKRRASQLGCCGRSLPCEAWTMASRLSPASRPLQVRETLKRKRFDQALELIDIAAAAGMGGAGPVSGAEAAASRAAAAAVSAHEGLLATAGERQFGATDWLETDAATPARTMVPL